MSDQTIHILDLACSGLWGQFGFRHRNL